jgi:molybdopterin-containing oxidoreductase family membrane subunit
MNTMARPSAVAATTSAIAGEWARVEHDLLATLDPLGRAGRVWIASLLMVCTAGLAAYVSQLAFGLRVTSMRNYVSWGAYMTNFVFFIGISHAGTLISAILRVTNAGWRRPITRMAEAITVLALLIGASMVVVDMGRPDRLLNVLRYGRLQSPILWDVVSITTYITGSFLYLYVAMIPDMPILARSVRARGRASWLVHLYDRLSLGYRDTPEHRRLLARALGAMAVIIIPVAVSVHTVVSWVFGMTLRPGWHSTIFGPYFVIGAIFSGTAAIITAMAIFRRAYRLERYLLLEHFRRLAMLLLALSLLYAYFTLSEYLTAWYGGLDADSRLLSLLAGGAGYGSSFWLWAGLGLFLPIVLLLMPGRRSLASIVTASVLINIGMWVKRYLIIVPTLQTPFIPADAAGITPHYFPSVVECLITAGAFAGFLLLFTLFSRIFPILSIWETSEAAVEVHAAPTIERGVPHGDLRPATLAVAFLAWTTISWLPWRRVEAQVQPAASVTLARATLDSQDFLVARVTANGTFVPNAAVEFSIRRALGFMILGNDTTGSQGIAKVPFPVGLPVDSHGELLVRVAVQLPTDPAAATVLEQKVEGGAPRVSTRARTSRALWSSRAPLPMLATIIALLLCVWGTYAFVVGQLVIMRHLKAPAG